MLRGVVGQGTVRSDGEERTYMCVAGGFAGEADSSGSQGIMCFLRRFSETDRYFLDSEGMNRLYGSRPLGR